MAKTQRPSVQVRELLSQARTLRASVSRQSLALPCQRRMTGLEFVHDGTVQLDQKDREGPPTAPTLAQALYGLLTVGGTARASAQRG
jgi:hypothetical protein